MTGVAGLAAIARLAYTDATQFDAANPYFDARSSAANPRWVNVDVTLVRKTRLLPLAELRGAPELSTMQVLRRGNRLSITPVTPDEWAAVLTRLGG